MLAIQSPSRSGKMAEFPEVDRAAWRSLAKALEKINKGQRPIIAALAERLDAEARRAVEARSG